MSFIHKSGPAHTEAFQKAASVAIAANSVLGFYASTGYVRQAEASSVRIAGICIRKVSSTDTDYALNSTMGVLVPGPEDIFEATVTGTAARTNVGNQFDIGTNSDGTAQTCDVGNNTYKVLTVVGFISTSKVLVKFNGNYVFANKAN